MKLQVILRTRSASVDYGWRCRPDYLSQKMGDQLSFIREMLGRNTDGTFAFGESLHNYYFFQDGECSVLVHGVITDQVDNHGRRIFTIEGLACPREKKRLFWYALPVLIDRMDRSMLFRQRYADLLDLQLPVSRDIETDFSDDDKLFLDMDDPKSLWYTMGDHSDAMLRLWRDVHDTDAMFSFVYGTRPRDFYPGFFERVYTPAAQNPSRVRPWSVQTCAQPEIAGEKNRFAVVIETELSGKGREAYEVSLFAMDTDGNEIARTDSGMRVPKSGIVLTQLIDARAAVRKCLTQYGYGKGGRQ